MSNVYDDNYDSYSLESNEGDSWISGFCSLVGHEYFCEVFDDFIDDDFNLTGLASMVPHFQEALEIISDLEPEKPLKLPNIPLVEHSAELLYGLIHARFIITKAGLHLMHAKYLERHFGVCPRYLCEHTPLLPMGRHDMPGFETVRLFCPCCLDLYIPPSSRYYNIDGAYFGTSFPGVFLKTFPEIEKQCQKIRSKQQFELKIYGIRIAEISKSGPRMKWLRQFPALFREIEDPLNNNNSTNNNHINSNNDSIECKAGSSRNSDEMIDDEEDEIEEEGEAEEEQNDKASQDQNSAMSIDRL